MLAMVGLVATMIQVFSIGYMHGDPRYSRFFAYLSLFCFSMLGLVLADNILALYIFWELVGLCSYLLIGFWFEKKSASDAAKKAFLTTRVGDVGMFLGLMITYWHVRAFDYDSIFRAVADGTFHGPALTAAGVLLFCGAVGKSAQFPLHTWLPDAMEGPTPVSALIHAATMVAAGVYMVGRLYLLLTAEALAVVAVIGVITAVLAASIAIVQNDIKRVLAYSTISQLGYMMAGLGVGGYVAGLFHLITHACFKALLFLGSGSVIHAVHTQDLREMGGLKAKMPVTYRTFLAGTLAISGVPLFSGFFSKDAILASALARGLGSPPFLLIFLALWIAAGVTAFYMFRLVFLCFFGSPRDRKKFDHAHESPRVMTIPLTVLAVFAVVGGGTFGVNWFAKTVHTPTLAPYRAEAPRHGGAAGAGTGGAHEGAAAAASEAAPPAHGEAAAHGAAAHGAVWRGPAVHEAASVEAIEHAEHGAHWPATGLSVLAAGLGIWVAYRIYRLGSPSAESLAERMRGTCNVLVHKYWFDEIYSALFVRPLLRLRSALGAFDLAVIDGAVNGSALLTKLTAMFVGWRLDLGGVDGAVNGTAAAFGFFGRQVRRIQTGRIQNYLLAVFAAVLVLVILRQLRG
jgi:NADH-quinone oxidoreductase subunit L